MRIRRFVQLVVVANLVLAALPLRAVRAASAESASSADLLQFTSGGHVLGFAGSGMYAATGSHALHVDFADANRVRPQSSTPASGDGQTAGLNRVDYMDLWDGITLTYTAGVDGIYTTTYTLAPGANPADIRLQYNAPLILNEDGTLSIGFETGALTETAPVAWQEIGGQRVAVIVSFRVTGQEVGFVLGDYDPDFALTIDPVLTWNTFLGGFGDDDGESIAVDADGNVYIAGWSSTNWGSPVRAYAGGTSDAFVVKLNSSGELVWSTYLGGSEWDSAYDLMVDSSGYIYVTGESSAAWGSPVRGFSGNRDAFVARLNSNGTLSWNTFLGGGDDDGGLGMSFEDSGNIAVVGSSGAAWGSPVRAFSAMHDAFVAKVNISTGSLLWLTFLGGSGDDFGNGIARDYAGGIYVTGESYASWGAPVAAHAGGNDAFAAKLNTSGSLTWNTFLGGSGDDRGVGIRAATNGSYIVVTGDSGATWGSPVRAYSGGTDAFAAKLGPAGALTWNTFLGGSADDIGMGLVVDGSDNIYVSGRSFNSWGSPVRLYSGGGDIFAAKLSGTGVLAWNTFLGSTTDDIGGSIAFLWSGYFFVCGSSMNTWGSPVSAPTESQDAFAAMLNGSSGALVWNTFAGGNGDDYGTGIAADADGNVYVSGYSASAWEYPSPGFSAGEDAFAAKLDSAGNLTWYTFLGGGGQDRGKDIAIDSDGNVFVTGNSTETWGSPIRAHAGGADAFAAKLDSLGALVWNTFLGSGEYDIGDGIIADGDGNIYITGSSDAAWGGPVRGFTDGNDAFIAKLSPSGALAWNTFLGGSDTDYGDDIDVSGNGNLYVSGGSTATWGSPVRAFSAGFDGFTAKLVAATGALTWNTFLGGDGEDMGGDIVVDGSGNAYVAGHSDETWGSPLRAHSGGVDGYAAKLDVNGNLMWHTFLGQTGTDFASGIGINSDGNVFVAGSSSAAWGVAVRDYTGSGDGFVAKLTPYGNLMATAFVGGVGNDGASSLAVDGSGNVIATGGSNHQWGASVRSYYDGYDAIVVKLNLNPPGAFGKLSPADGSYTTTDPTLIWEASSDVVDYLYCYDTTDDDACTTWIYVDGSFTSVYVTGLTNNETYYWGVRALSPTGTTSADGGAYSSFTARNQTFADVPIDHPLWAYIEALYSAGITTGCGFDPLIFCPANNVTRASMAVFLLRAKYGAGYAPPAASHYFSDLPVAGKEWQEAWVDQFYREGITSGCGFDPLIYCPENPVTRAAMAVFILRTLEGASYTPPAASHFFADLPVAGKEWMEPWVDELYRRGITTGCGTGPLIYCPENPVKRQAMAAFIVRAFNLPLP